MFRNRITLALLLIFLIGFDCTALYLTLHPDVKNTIWLSGACSVAVLACIRWATYGMSKRLSTVLLYALLLDSAVHVVLYMLARTFMA